MPFNLSTGELLVLLLVAVCVFGGNLPSVARKVGGAISEFKRGMKEEMRRIEHDVAPPPSWQPPPDGENCEGLAGPKPDEEAKEEFRREPPAPTPSDPT